MDEREVIEDPEVFEIIPAIKHKAKAEAEGLKDTDFTQSQGHGLFWDNQIRERVFELPSCKNDTKKYDICCSENRFNPCENVSIKTSSNDNIDCGDILRFFNGDFTNKYTIILIRYKQVGDKKQIKEIIELDYNLELRNYLFGSITEDILTNYVDLIKSIPHGHVSDDVKNNYKALKNKLQIDHNMKINISPKVDSKTQRRVQCSIPKMNHLMELFPSIVISRTFDSVVRGVELSSEIQSTSRVRTKKINNL